MPTDLTSALLRTIGSPFAGASEAPSLEEDFLRIYRHSLKNKIGLLYLSQLKEQGKLCDDLEAEYTTQREKLHQSLITLKRVAGVLNRVGITYVVYKSIMPFPTVLNDVDVLVLDQTDGYREACFALVKAGFKLIASAPHEKLFHDQRDRQHKDPTEKDVYDVDLYAEIGASYVISFDKRKLIDYQRTVKVMNVEVPVFTPEAELPVSLMHAVYPEQLYTLLHYYATLHYLSMMNSESMNNFFRIVKENHIIAPIRSMLALAATLHYRAHGFVPEKMVRILTGLGATGLNVEANFEVPQHFRPLNVIRPLLGKALERKVTISFIRQGLSTLKPSVAKLAVRQLVLRQRRDTY